MDYKQYSAGEIKYQQRVIMFVLPRYDLSFDVSYAKNLL